MSPHKLLIWITWDHPEKYKNLLRNEFVRGITIKCKAHISNYGEQTFPTGKIIFLRTVHGGHQSHYSLGDGLIDTLEKNQEKVFSFDLTLNEEGWFWVEIGIEAFDKQPIEYYQTRQTHEIPFKDHWRNGFLTLNREQLDILLSLKEISTKLNKRERTVKKTSKRRR